MLDTKSKVYNSIQQLSSVAASLSKAPASSVMQLRDELLALPDDNQYQPGGRSGLNADGSPLQYCISTSTDGWNGRFLSDPACIIGSSSQRYRQSYDALQRLYGITGTQAIQPVFENMLSFHLPASAENFDMDYPDGVLWLGASPDAEGLAAYMDGRRGGHHASWDRLLDWLNQLMPANTEGAEMVSNIREHASIMSVGLEGSSMQNLRAKVYFRLMHPRLLNELGIPLLQRSEFAAFCTTVVGSKNIKLSGLVFSIGFHIASGKMYDAKIDICGCGNCVSLQTGSWLQLLDLTTAQYSVAPFPLSSEVLEKSCSVSYYGIGVTRKGDVRLNLYLKNKLN